MKLDSNPNIEILRSAHEAYECLTVEIYYLGESIAQINQDNGKDSLELELFTGFCDPHFIVKFPLADFLEALKLAQKSLQY
jgi:hypothetical protein